MNSKPVSLGRLLVASLAIACLPFVHGQSELVFQDNFNLPFTSNDVNEGLAGRQTGTAAPVPYTENPDTAAGGNLDDFTQLYNNGLSLIVTGWTWVAPNRNFTDGPTFTIGFDLDPSVMDPFRVSEDWAAVVFGATAPGQFVNASNGMGILFRSDGRIQVFNGTQAVHGSSLEDALPAGTLRIRIEVTGQDFSGTTPATVALFVNDTPVPLTGTDLTFTRPQGFQGNHITLQGYAEPGNTWEYSFDNLTVRADTCVRLDPQEIVLDSVPPGNLPITVRVPATFNNSQGGAVTVRSSNPGVVAIVGAQDNVLTLNFTPGGPLSQTVNLSVVGRGRAQILLATEAPDCVGGAATILTPLIAHLQNPSFEKNYPTDWPHYGAIEDWTGGSGVNEGGGPFHDNAVVPDRARIAFLQGVNTLSQNITGLAPGQTHWLQLRYNSRGCCGGETPDMTVRIDGVVLGTEAAIQPAGTAYYFRNFEFIPASDVALLEISSQPHAGGDATLLVDAVTVIQRDPGNVVVQNPSFEASGLIPLPGIFTNQRISGWQGEGVFGLNLAGDPFADNGITPHGNLVAFVQGAGSLSQTLTGLIPGETYQVDFAYNARAGNQPNLRVTAGEIVLLDTTVAPVGNAAYHAGSGSFLATVPSAVLRFAQTAEGDQTVLLDNIRVTGQAINLPCIQLAPERVQLSVGQTSSEITVKLLEEVVADGPATVTVASSNPAVASLPGAVNGVLTLTFQSGGDLVQTVSVTGVSRGSATLQFAEPRGVCFDRSGIEVLVLGGFVRNPSFEANSNPTWPGYGPIASWTSDGPGNTGINGPTGPFHDNGVIPDRGQIALLQTTKSIRQEIVNLTPGQRYWLQFYYNVRNCCGGTIDLTVRFAGTELETFPNILPVMETNPYYFAHLEFTPTAASGLLEFAATSAGDATVLLDAVTIVQRNPGGLRLRNPSFEASGIVPSPGYIDTAIAGWSTGGGGRGVNLSGVGPFADNGTNPDQDSVLFLQGEGTFASQNLAGLNAGQNYTVRFAANARTGNQPVLKVMLDDFVAFEEPVTSVGNNNAYHALEVVVPATANEGVLRFEQAAAGDNTVLIDNVTVVPGGVLPEPRVRLTAGRDDQGRIRLSWPASATGYVLQSTTALPGGWQNATEPVVVEGNLNIVTLEPGAAARFFRLRK